jgi:hypothetical protein
MKRMLLIFGLVVATIGIFLILLYVSNPIGRLGRQEPFLVHSVTDRMMIVYDYGFLGVIWHQQIFLLLGAIGVVGGSILAIVFRPVRGKE